MILLSNKVTTGAGKAGKPKLLSDRIEKLESLLLKY